MHDDLFAYFFSVAMGMGAGWLVSLLWGQVLGLAVGLVVFFLLLVLVLTVFDTLREGEHE